MSFTLDHSSRHAANSAKDATQHQAVCRVIVGKEAGRDVFCDTVLPLSEILRDHHKKAHPELDGMSMIFAAKGLGVLRD